jgi:carbon-monoxide dehydrogenase small subunit
MLATGFLRETSNPTDEEIREAMSSNLCRCTGYQGIIDAVRAAAGKDGKAAVEEMAAPEGSGEAVDGLPPLRGAGGHQQ